LEQVGGRMTNTRSVCNNFANKALRMSLEQVGGRKVNTGQFSTS
jgi:hypothetical protein